MNMHSNKKENKKKFLYRATKRTNDKTTNKPILPFQPCSFTSSNEYFLLRKIHLIKAPIDFMATQTNPEKNSASKSPKKSSIAIGFNHRLV